VTVLGRSVPGRIDNKHSADTPWRLRRGMGRLPRAPLSRSALEISWKRAAWRLSRAQYSDGHYLYWYHPVTQEIRSDPGNLVRQAGSAYAMALAARSAVDTDAARSFEVSATKAVAFLAAAAHGSDNLGLIALSSLAIQHLGRLSNDVRADNFVRAIVSAQRRDGSFRCRAGSCSAEEDGAKQDFFPGQALLVLAGEASRGHTEFEGILTRAFGWYRDWFRRRPSTAFALWQVDAWRLAAEFLLNGGRGEDIAIEYASFVFEIVDWLLQFQLSNSIHAEQEGAFVARCAPGAATACYAEAAMRASALAARVGDFTRFARYGAAGTLGMEFVLSLQIAPDTHSLFADPTLVDGGITASLENFSLRCDRDQHAITASIAALQAPW
jgi:hypothetical protein